MKESSPSWSISRSSRALVARGFFLLAGAATMVLILRVSIQGQQWLLFVALFAVMVHAVRNGSKLKALRIQSGNLIGFDIHPLKPSVEVKVPLSAVHSVHAVILETWRGGEELKKILFGDARTVHFIIRDQQGKFRRVVDTVLVSQLPERFEALKQIAPSVQTNISSRSTFDRNSTTACEAQRQFFRRMLVDAAGLVIAVAILVVL